MGDKNEKSIFTGKPKFPLDGVIVLSAFTVLILIGLNQYQKDHDLNWLWLLSVIFGVTLMFGILFNSMYKTLILTQKKLKIKYWLFGRLEYNLKEIKGYDLKEEYDRSGLVKNVRIWVNEDKYIVFFHNSYPDINKLIQGLKKGELLFLGTQEITSTYKNWIKWFMIIAGMLTTLGLLFVQLMKIMK